MTINRSEQTELLNQITELQEKQAALQRELFDLQRQIRNLPVEEPVEFNKTPFNQPPVRPVQPPVVKKTPVKKVESSPMQNFLDSTGINSGLEKFVGENLINKVGIMVLIIGVGIGAKYAIDNDLISPLVRIILGYLVGLSLAGFAIRLKSKYLNFSAVLFSGAMAIQYFITYAANSYYNLFPQIVAIALMVIITILTVALALYYKQQVIAHFGLVGAYIVPYLLKDPFLNITILFIYIAIINSGILYISVKKQWKPLNYLAFIATWIIFESWFLSQNYQNQVGTCLVFLSIFFLIFHSILLSYKLILREKLAPDDLVYLILNAAILFFTGFAALQNNESSSNFKALFTFLNAVFYGLSALLINFRKQESDRFLIWHFGLIIAFVTIAIPVQLQNYETAIVWAFEATILFIFGRTNRKQFFEISSYIVLFVLFIISIINWGSIHYDFQGKGIEKLFMPVFNFQFLSSFVTLLAFASIFLISYHPKSKNQNDSETLVFFNIFFPVAFFIVLYFTFYNEISIFWNNRKVLAGYKLNESDLWINQYNIFIDDVRLIKNIWLTNYTLILAVLISFVNFKLMKNSVFNAVILVFKFFLVLFFLAMVVQWTTGLEKSLIQPDIATNFDSVFLKLTFRYSAYAFFALMLISTYKYILPLYKNSSYAALSDIIVCISIVRVSSVELISWLSVSGANDVYKYGLSVLWGVLSLIAVGYGIWKRKKHLRITGIALLGITLLKLFFYDLTNLETIPKTLVFILTGGLLLVVSYLYNKYTNKIFGSETDKT